jgi:hypothetical protein
VGWAVVLMNAMGHTVMKYGWMKETKNAETFMNDQVFTAVIVKSILFWDITLCSPLEAHTEEEHITSIFRFKE